MRVVVLGLGPMGGGIGAHLAERGHEVLGVDIDPDRAAQWSGGIRPVSSALEDVPWADAEALVVGVRLYEHVRAALEVVARSAADRPLAVVVITTLAVSDARELPERVPEAWRIFELPVSGGPEGARTGALSAMLAGPVLEPAERALIDDIAQHVFLTEGYGEPAALKLLNNTLGAYVAASTATMLELAETLGIAPARFLEVARASSGQSWMADNFPAFHHLLLIKDVGLLQRDVAELPVVDLADPERLDAVVVRARALLGAEGVPA